MNTIFDAIVLRSIKYSETSLIVKTYTRQSGLKSFIIKGARSRAKKKMMALFQPLSAVEIVSSVSRNNSSLSHIKEIKSRYQFLQLHSDPYKIGVVFFISEILDKVLKEEEVNSMLFEFVDTAIHFFDELEDYSNFHIYFLIELTKYLGFQPLVRDIDANFFDIENGILLNDGNSDKINPSTDQVQLLVKILGMKFVEKWEISLKRSQRNSILDLLINYYAIHIHGIEKLKSLEVLKNLYHS